MKLVNVRKSLERDLKKTSFKKEYDGLEEEFVVAKKLTDLRLKNQITQS